MATQVNQSSKTNTLWYRLKRYPRISLLSFVMVLLFVLLLFYYFGKIYPEFMLFDKLSSYAGFSHNQKYNFYSGQTGGDYNTIGNWVSGIYEDGDTVVNTVTSGGSENAMKTTMNKNSFALIQEEILNHDDQLLNNVRVVTPLFMERMHIFYREGLFKKADKDVQLSAIPDTCLLQCMNDTVINVNMGIVGTATRIMASYVMALLEKQVNPRKHAKRKTKINQLNELFSASLKKMQNCSARNDSTVDILFFLSADPTDVIRQVLESCQGYKLMSIDPSFVVLLNKEFNLNLQVADFKNKYTSASNISTFGTLTDLIASKTIRTDDIYKLLKKLSDNDSEIVCALNPITYYAEKQAIFDVGFLNLFQVQQEASANQKAKEIIIYFFSVVALFLPVFRSVIGFKYIWLRWSINKKIDEIDDAYKLGQHTKDAAVSKIEALQEKVVNLYSDGL